MENLTIIIGLVIAIVLVVVGYFILKFLKNFLINSLVGVVALIIFNLLSPLTKIEVPITIITILVTGFLGVFGTALIIISAIFGFNIK